MPCHNHKLVYKMREIVSTFKEKYSEMLNIISIKYAVSIRWYGAKCFLSLQDEKCNRDVLETSIRVTCKKETEILTAFLHSIDLTILLLQDGIENDLPSSKTPIVID